MIDRLIPLLLFPLSYIDAPMHMMHVRVHDMHTMHGMHEMHVIHDCHLALMHYMWYSTHRDFLAWEQSASRVLYCFASCVGEQPLSYVRDAKMPKGAWETLKKIFAASTTARKLQLRQELSNLRQRDLSVVN